MEEKDFEPAGLIPRSIIRTVERFQQQLRPETIALGIQEFRISRYQVRVSVRYFFILLLLPITLNWGTKNLIIKPLVGYFWNTYQTSLFLNSYQAERAFQEMRDFESQLFFEMLTSSSDNFTEEKPNQVLQRTIGSDYSKKLNYSKTNLVDSYINYQENTKKEVPIKTLFSEFALSDVFSTTSNLESQDSVDNFTLLFLPWLLEPQEQKIIGIPSYWLIEHIDLKARQGQSLFDITGLDLGSARGLVTKASWAKPSSLDFKRSRPWLCGSEIFSLASGQALRAVASVVEKDPGSFDFSLEQKWLYGFPENDQFRESLGSVASENVAYRRPKEPPTGGPTTKGPKTKGLAPVLGFWPSPAGQDPSHRPCKSGSLGKCFPDLNKPPQIKTEPLVQEFPTLQLWPFNTLVFLENTNLKQKLLEPLETPISAQSVFSKKTCSSLTTDQKPFITNLYSQSEFQIQKTDMCFAELFQKKTVLLAEVYNQQSITALSNMFGDCIMIFATVLLVRWNAPQFTILKSFLIESFYSFNDAIKCFYIILITDFLVGFHSPRGWEIVMEILLRHLGLPENEEFILLFVGTFPVFLDTAFKYWIFRYLNKISPSTVATYHSMIE